MVVLGWMAGVAGVAGLGAAVWYVVAAPRSQVVCASVWRGPRESEAVALTFDDGPGESTSAVLDLLRQHGARATFFLCAKNVERYPELARRIAEEGHEIGNHTYGHPRLLGRSPGQMAWEIERAQRIIAFRTGKTPRWFRPPYGLRWFGLGPILERNGLRMAMWSVNGKDWRLAGPGIARRVVGSTEAGAIVLLHDGVPPSAKEGSRKGTVEALPEILRELGRRFRLVPVSELVAKEEWG